MSELNITNLSFSGASPAGQRQLYVAFQLGTQVHSTSTSIGGTWNESVQFRNAQVQDQNNAQMLITVCVHDPSKSPEILGQTVVSAGQLLAGASNTHSFPIYNFSGVCTGTVGFRCSAAQSQQHGQTAYPATGMPQTGAAAGTASHANMPGAGTTSYPSATTRPSPAPGTDAPPATATPMASTAQPKHPQRKPSFMDQARVGLADTLGSLQRGLETTKVSYLAHHSQPGGAPTAPPTGQPGFQNAAHGAAGYPGAPPPGQHYQAKELPQSMLNHTKALLTDLASYTQYGIEKARVALQPKPASGTTMPART